MAHLLTKRFFAGASCAAELAANVIIRGRTSAIVLFILSLPSFFKVSREYGGSGDRRPVKEAQLEAAVVAYAKVAGIGGRVDRDHGGKEWGMRDGERMLRAPLIGTTHGADLATAPGLGADPLGGVVTVVDIIAHQPPMSLGVVAPTRVLRDRNVTRPHELRQITRVVFVVRGALQDNGELACSGNTVMRGTIDVGGPPHAVAHGHHHITSDHALVGRGALGTPRGENEQNKSRT